MARSALSLFASRVQAAPINPSVRPEEQVPMRPAANKHTARIDSRSRARTHARRIATYHGTRYLPSYRTPSLAHKPPPRLAHEPTPRVPAAVRRDKSHTRIVGRAVVYHRDGLLQQPAKYIIYLRLRACGRQPAPLGCSAPPRVADEHSDTIIARRHS